MLKTYRVFFVMNHYQIILPAHDKNMMRVKLRDLPPDVSQSFCKPSDRHMEQMEA